jgi:hypothetical protein
MARMDRRWGLIGSRTIHRHHGAPRVEWLGERGTAPVVMRPERLENVIAYRALKRIQVGTQECRHDAGIMRAWQFGQAGRSMAAGGAIGDSG